MDAEETFPQFELRPHEGDGQRELVIRWSPGQASTWPGLRDEDVAALWTMLTMSKSWAWSNVPEILPARAEIRRRVRSPRWHGALQECDPATCDPDTDHDHDPVRVQTHPDPGPNCPVCGGTLPHCQVNGACKYLDSAEY